MTEHREPYAAAPSHPFGWDKDKDVDPAPVLPDQLVNAARTLLIDLRHYILDNEQKKAIICLAAADRMLALYAQARKGAPKE